MQNQRQKVENQKEEDLRPKVIIAWVNWKATVQSWLNNEQNTKNTITSAENNNNNNNNATEKILNSSKEKKIWLSRMNEIKLVLHHLSVTSTLLQLGGQEMGNGWGY